MRIWNAYNHFQILCNLILRKYSIKQTKKVTMNRETNNSHTKAITSLPISKVPNLMTFLVGVWDARQCGRPGPPLPSPTPTTLWNVIKTPKWKYQTINTVVHLAPKFWFEKHYYHDVLCTVYGIYGIAYNSIYKNKSLKEN